MPPVQRQFAGRAVLATAVVAGVAIVAFVVAKGVAELAVAFVAIILGTVLRGSATWLSRKTGMPVGAAIALVVLLVTVALGGLSWIVGDTIGRQMEQASGEIPKSVAQAKEALSGTAIGKLVLQVVPGGSSAGTPSGGASSGGTSSGGTSSEGAPAPLPMPSDGVIASATSFVYAVLDAVGLVVVTPILAIFLAIAPETYLRLVEGLFPERKRKAVRDVLLIIGEGLRWWFVGQLLSMVEVGVFTTLGLWFIGVPTALLLGVVASLLNFIPNFGPVISVIPAMLIAVAAGKSPWAVLALYTVIQGIDGFVVMPLVQRKMIDVPPVALIVLQLLLTTAFGFPGLLVAAPLSLVLHVLHDQLYRPDVLDEPPKDTEVPGGEPA